MDGAQPRWSVVIPAFDEAHRLPRYLPEMIAYLDGLNAASEVLVVDDGSRDGTADGVLALAATRPNLSLCRLGENRGKGCAVRTGMLRARGALRLMADADGATPIAEASRLEEAIRAGADIAVGSRALADPRVIVVARRHRKLFGRMFHLLVRAVGVAGITDTQCGFKLLRGRVADALFPHVATDGFGFDVELLLLAQRAGYRLVEVPVNWVDQAGSKVGVWRDGPRMLIQILRVRRRLAAAAREGIAS